jgi:hypothetical protein
LARQLTAVGEYLMILLRIDFCRDNRHVTGKV